jgi:hypothetical protein
VIHLDLTVLDRLDAAGVTVTLDNFVSVLAAETYRAECEYLSGDRSSDRKEWGDGQ